ncbi:MAG: hypothetical protein H6707_17920 [Deltaproteobacteria bacterium]|nr:hypothetical protein [Deltaproteobacteria bacterium]
MLVALLMVVFLTACGRNLSTFSLDATVADALATGRSDAGVAGDGFAVADGQAQPDAGPIDLTTAAASDAVRACARLAACLPSHHIYAGSTEACLARLYGQGPGAFEGFHNGHAGGVFGELACLGQSQAGCDALDQCLGVRFADHPAADKKRCDGDRLVGHASFLGESSIDCARFAAKCQPLEHLDSDGIRGTDSFCVTSRQCTASWPNTWLNGRCDGSRVMLCLGGKEVVWKDCAQNGLPCRDGQCRGTGPACTDRHSRCENATRLIGCAGKWETVLDCRAFGANFGCQAGADGAHCQFRQAVPCTGGCLADGRRLRVCNAGEPVVVDCVALGLGGCLAGGCVARLP